MPSGDSPFGTLNGEKYRVDLKNWIRRDAEVFVQAIREGYASGAARANESEVGWRTWQGGAFQSVYNAQEPDRYSSSTNVWALTPGQIVLGPKRQSTIGISAAVTSMRTPDAAGRTVALTATDVFYRDSGADTFTNILPTVTPTDVIEFDGNYLVGMGASNAYQYKNALTATGWTASTLGTTLQTAKLWASGLPGTGSNGGLLWKAVGREVASTSNPLNAAGNWTTAYKVGSSKFDINGLRIIDARLIVSKPEGIFWVKPDGVVEPLFSFQDAIHTDNGKLLVQAHTGVVLTNWMAGLVAFTPGGVAMNVTVNEVWKQAGLDVRYSDTETRGRFVAACAGPTCTYFILYDAISSNYYLVAWTGESPNRGWHPIHKFDADASVLGFEQPSTGTPRVYAKNGTGSPVYFKLPQSSEEPRNDTGFEFETTGTITMAEYESPLPEMTKMQVYLDLRVEGSLAAGSVYVEVEASTDGGSYEVVGTIDSVGSYRLQFSPDSSGKRLKVRLRLYGTANASPRIRALYHGYILVSPSRKEWDLWFFPGTGIGDLRTTFEAEDDLKTLKDSFAGYPWVDIDERQYTVLVRAVEARTLDVEHGKQAILGLHVNMLESLGPGVSLDAGDYGMLERLTYGDLEGYTYGALEALSV